MSVACEAVSALGGVLDPVFAGQRAQGGHDGGCARGGALADLTLGERRLGVGEDLKHALFGRLTPRDRLLVRGLAETQGEPLAIAGEFDRDIGEPGRGAVLGGEQPNVLANFRSGAAGFNLRTRNFPGAIRLSP